MSTECKVKFSHIETIHNKTFSTVEIVFYNGYIEIIEYIILYDYVAKTILRRSVKYFSN